MLLLVVFIIHRMVHPGCIRGARLFQVAPLFALAPRCDFLRDGIDRETLIDKEMEWKIPKFPGRASRT
jgi:hypothetical protein